MGNKVCQKEQDKGTYSCCGHGSNKAMGVNTKEIEKMAADKSTYEADNDIAEKTKSLAFSGKPCNPAC